MYTVYLNIEYPKILIEHFQYFDSFSLKFIPNFLPKNKNFLHSEPGF